MSGILHKVLSKCNYYTTNHIKFWCVWCCRSNPGSHNAAEESSLPLSGTPSLFMVALTCLLHTTMRVKLFSHRSGPYLLHECSHTQSRFFGEYDHSQSILHRDVCPTVLWAGLNRAMKGKWQWEKELCLGHLPRWTGALEGLVLTLWASRGMEGMGRWRVCNQQASEACKIRLIERSLRWGRGSSGELCKSGHWSQSWTPALMGVFHYHYPH